MSTFSIVLPLDYPRGQRFAVSFDDDTGNRLTVKDLRSIKRVGEIVLECTAQGFTNIAANPQEKST